MKIFTILSFAFCLTLLTPDSLISQQVVMDETVSDQVFSKRFGPNGTHYVWQYFSWSVPVTGRSEQQVKTFLSGEYNYGIKYKYRLGTHFSTIGEWNLGASSYAFKKLNTLQPYHLLNEWEDENISMVNTTLAWHGRLNFGKRGNHMGKYLDFGVFGGWNFSRSHIYNGIDNGLDVTALRNKPDYIRKMGWGISCGIGFNHMRLISRYRVSDYLVKGKVNGGDLPKWVIGLEIGLRRFD